MRRLKSARAMRSRTTIRQNRPGGRAGT